MSFTADIKRELVKTIPERREARLALLQAVLKTCGERSEDGFSFVSENEDIVAYVIGIAESCFGEQMTLTQAVRDPKHGRDKFKFSLTGKRAAESADEILNQEIASEENSLAFLKGTFLGGGSCILPRGENRTGYHLEFVFSEKQDAELFIEAANTFQLVGGTVERGDKYVIYCKSREAIGDFLSVLGAKSCLKTLERTAAARDRNNNRNRLENCMAGNVDRSLTVSARQVRTLRLMQESGKLIPLTGQLKETAQARLENPTLNYSELAALLGISKSCLQHRLTKLMSLQGEKP